MSENAGTPASERNIWVRGFLMLLMAFVFQVSGTVTFVIAILQFILALVSDTPNDRLVAFGRSLALYLQQIASFLTFASEELPFPFNEWPEGA